ncbi:MAG: hypothetical protein A2W19_01960 [Spirochaetes bacterium RBG_16_49_21]|nr:MAG: hypothetical protein A2W19_01960 [Spirochaetes bacterium RBG_16_49_21]
MAITKRIILIIFLVSLFSCGKHDFLSDKTFSSSSKNALNSLFNSYPYRMSEVEPPAANDALSSSTNSSEQIRDPAVKPKGIEGATFILPPQPNNYGAVSLAYPIELPAGRDGMHPAVGLVYSSSAGDGLVGVGWSLSTGLGSISRSTDEGELYYDYRDTFLYNGRRLVKVSGPSNSENGTYRLEIESGFLKLELANAEQGGVWKVSDQSGAVAVYGPDQERRVFLPDDPTRTFSWLFSRIENLNGNYLEASYDSSGYDDSHIRYLKEIRYTGNSFMNMPARQYVRFHYKERDDSFVSTSAGFIMSMNKLLDRIEVGWDDPDGSGNTGLWQYELVYDISKDSSRPLLVTVESNRTSTKPSFSYNETTHSLEWWQVRNPDAGSSIAPAPSGAEVVKYFEGDFNGDGIADMVYFNPQTGDWRAAEGFKRGDNFEYLFKTYGNMFRGYDSDSKIQFFKGNVTGDYNGDGRSDIAFYLTKTREFWVAESTGRGFEFRKYGEMLPVDIDIFKCEWFPGDFDGNGLSDSILYNEPTGDWILMRNKGGSFEFIKFSKHFQNLFRYDYAPNSNMDSSATRDSSVMGKDRGRVHFFTGDFNGDGRSDISLYDERSGAWWVAENYREDGPHPQPLSQGERGVNFVLQWRLYKKFTAPEQALFANDRFTGDFNADGLSDFLLFDRDSGEWIIGETRKGTINFRVFSRAPQFREITRWLQGDFNGDGRTDLGFYSATDNNFWIGEATPDGFRWRIYSNMRSGPDPDRVMRAPLPMDEVIMTENTALVSSSAGTAAVSYRYDGNRFAGKGEIAFPGYFTSTPLGTSAPELLIFKRSENSLYFKRGDAEPYRVLSNIDLDGTGSRIMNHERPARFKAHDGIVYHTMNKSFYQITHNFNLIHYDGTFRNEPYAVFTASDIRDFSIDQSLYFIDSFAAGDANKYLMVLDDRAEVPRFVRFVQPGTPETISIDTAGALKPGDFTDMRTRRRSFRFFTGKFTAQSSDPAQVLIADVSGSTHTWYLGTVSGSTIYFESLVGTPSWQGGADQASLRYHAAGGALVYASVLNTRVQFHRIAFDRINLRITQTDYNYLDQGVVFDDEYDFQDTPAVRTTDGFKKAVLGAGSVSLQPLNAPAYDIARPDLMERYYPFRWVQGDYNGDGMTDVGIFSLKESAWYYALSQGTVPDLLGRVENGIGGAYTMEYLNSSSLDNTGDDDIPDLPMNYRVCSRVTVFDGRGGSYSTRYEHANGYAFSAFINGRKETDYFGFGEFSAIDASGARVKNLYHNAPYSDFRKNRALAGAIKESRFFGEDNKEYSRTEYEYKLHEIVPLNAPPTPGGGGPSSFLVEPARVKKYVKDVLVSTTESSIELAPNQYELVSRTGRVTDHYKDSVHAETSAESFTEFETVESTNQTRITRTRSFRGTPYETTTSFQYDGKGNVSEKRIAYAGGGLFPVSDKLMAFEYDGYGNLFRTTDQSEAPSRVVESLYDDRLHQFMVEERAYKESGYISARSVIDYGSAFGAAREKIDANGNRTMMEIDRYGRITRVSADTDSGVMTLMECSYSTDLPLSARVVQYSGSGSGNIATAVYADGLGREIHTVKSGLEEPGRPLYQDRHEALRRGGPHNQARPDRLGHGRRDRGVPAEPEHEASHDHQLRSKRQGAEGDLAAGILRRTGDLDRL